MYLDYKKVNSANPLYLIINTINGYIEEGNGNNVFTFICRTLVPADKSKDALK